MKPLANFLTGILIFTFVLAAVNIQPALADSDNDKVRVMIEYKPGQKRAVETAAKRAGAVIHYDFDNLNTLALTLPAAALDGISRNPNVVSVEEDAIRYMIGTSLPRFDLNQAISAAGDPFTEQVVPYGIDMVQARDVWDSNRDGVVDTGAPTGGGFTICIIDSGINKDHVDLSGVNMLGGYPTGWDSDLFGHGTHVAGTIAAMNNSLGVVGVTPGTVSLYFIKVFGDDGAWSYSSTLMDAANRCAAAGADIISMSLGGTRSNRQERITFDNLYAAGILSVAAASNEGTTAYSYPASYDSVVSVAAIDESMQWADFSNFNDQVELAAPGVGVLSTVPYLESNTLVVDGTTYAAQHIEFAARGTATGTLAHGGLCGTVGAWTGQVVLCERGTQDFYTKVMNVQNGGGVAAVIYNNAPGNFFGTLGEGNTSSIVGISLSQEDGQYLVANKLGLSGTVSSSISIPDSGYEAWDGTSMATPHVSAVAALVWSCLPTASNAQVRQALTNTALDLGTAGRDNYYGYGLVQAATGCNLLNPTSVDLLSFTATGAKKSIILDWETASEHDNLGFNLYRATSIDGARTKVNDLMIPASRPGSLIGTAYTYTDTGLIPKRTYYYWLEDIDIYGRTELHGPVEAITTNK